MRAKATLLAGSLLLGASGAQAASFNYIELDAPGYASTTISALPGALNDHDQVVGTVGNEASAQGFVWHAGQFTFYPQVRSLAVINQAGVAVGLPAAGHGYVSIDTTNGAARLYRDFFRGSLYGIDAAAEVVAQGPHRGLLLHAGAKTPLMVPGATSTVPTAIDDSGTVTGSYASGTQNAGFFYADGTYTSFEAPDSASTNPVFITANGVIGGSFTSTITEGPVGFVRRGGKFYPYLPSNADFSEVVGIGPGGEVVGSFEDVHIVGHGFVFRGGTFYQIDVPDAADTFVDGINARGSLIGTFVDQNGHAHAFFARCPADESCTQ